MSIGIIHPFAEVAANYRRATARRVMLLLTGAGALICCFLLDLATGPALLAVGDVVRALAGTGTEPMITTIVWSLRLPIAVMAVLVGAALGLTGALMQTMLNNPLASSYTLGISAGAGFGAALVIVFGLVLPVPEAYAIPVMAFLFSGLTCAGVYAIGQRRGASPQVLVLAGIAFLFLFQALLSLLQFIASPEALQAIVFWLFGSLQRASWAKAAIVAMAIAAVLPFFLRNSWAMTAMRLGDERARGLGIDVSRLRVKMLVVVSALTGVAVAFTGTIGFIGLVAPHMARMLVGEDQRIFLPGAALAGALLLSAASVASKLICLGAIIPIGIVTALIGVPFFLWMIMANRRTFF